MHRMPLFSCREARHNGPDKCVEFEERISQGFFSSWRFDRRKWIAAANASLFIDICCGQMITFSFLISWIMNFLPARLSGVLNACSRLIFFQRFSVSWWHLSHIVTSFWKPNAGVNGRQAPFPADPVHAVVGCHRFCRYYSLKPYETCWCRLRTRFPLILPTG